MTFLTRVALANRLIVGLVALAILVFGVMSAIGLRQELLPSTQVPTGIITAVYRGASPEIVADEVSTPIENVVKSVSGVTKVSSTSTSGFVSIIVEWEYGLDSDKMATNIRGAVDSVKATLPTDVDPTVTTGSTDDIPVLLLAVASDAPITVLGPLVDKVAVPELTGIDGVRQVTVSGKNATQVAVKLRPKDLRKHDLSAAAVTQILSAQTTVLPAGSSYSGTLELPIEVGNAVSSVKQVKAISIATTDGPIPLSSIADVNVESVQSTSIARSSGRPALSVSITKNADADAVSISHQVAAMIPSLEQKLGNNTTFATVFDQAPLIEQSIHDLTSEGALGLAFAVLIILVFLFSLRATLITAISIPMSVMIALIGLQLGNFSLNIFTLAAMTVAVGRVVDDSIVVLENIKRRDLGHASLTPSDILASVKEVAGAVTASTLTTIVVFLPVAFVSGVVGELFKPFAITVALALAASLVVSMTLVPVLAYWFLRSRKQRVVRAAAVPAGTDSDAGSPASTGVAAAGSPAGAAIAAPPVTAAIAASTIAPQDGIQHTVEETKVTRLQRGYLPVLQFGLRHPVITLTAAVLVFVATMGSATLLKTDFIGDAADKTTLQISQKLPSGTRLAVTSDAAAEIEKVLAGKPEVKGYLTSIGGGGIQAGGLLGASGSNLSSITVQLHDGTNRDALRDDLQTELSAMKDVGEVTVSTQQSGGTSTDITVTVQGDNPKDLRAGAEQIEQMLAATPGLSDVTTNLADQRKLLKVDVDLKKAAAKGFTQAEVGQAISNALTGSKVGTVTLSGQSRDIVVRVGPGGDLTPKQIGALQLPVSQLQQANAQTKASDKLTAKQKKATNDAQAKQDKAVADQRAALEKQRTAAVKSLNSTEDALKKLEASPPPPPPPVPPIPVTADVLAQQQYQAALAQHAQQIVQLNAAVKQSNAAIKAVDKQLDAVTKQETQTNEQRAQQSELSDQQEALADVRATPITVAAVAKVSEMLAPTSVTQIDGTPSVTISATPTGSDLGALTKTVQSKLDSDDSLAPGVTAVIGGASQDQQEAFNQLGQAMLLAIVMVFVIMVATFRSLVQPLILLVSIPFAATGAVVGLLVTDTALGVPAMVGLLMLIGIVVTNAIVLIDLINQYRERGEPLRTAIVDGARLRLRPIIMTACATIFALVPMGLGLTGGGAFISRPLAIVVIGGLVSSTVLTLLLVPVLYSLVERRNEKKRLAAHAAPAPGSAAPGAASV